MHCDSIPDSVPEPSVSPILLTPSLPTAGHQHVCSVDRFLACKTSTVQAADTSLAGFHVE